MYYLCRHCNIANPISSIISLNAIWCNKYISYNLLSSILLMYIIHCHVHIVLSDYEHFTQSMLARMTSRVYYYVNSPIKFYLLVCPSWPFLILIEWIHFLLTRGCKQNFFFLLYWSDILFSVKKGSNNSNL